MQRLMMQRDFMHTITHAFSILTRSLALTTLFALGVPAMSQTEPLPSWNDGAAKQAIMNLSLIHI